MQLDIFSEIPTQRRKLEFRNFSHVSHEEGQQKNKNVSSFLFSDVTQHYKNQILRSLELSKYLPRGLWVL